MAKKDTKTEAQTEDEKPVEQTENQLLFGQLTDEDKARAGFTDEELAGMEDDEETEATESPEEAEADGETEAADATEETAEGDEAEETEETEPETAEGEEAEEETAEGEVEGEAAEETKEEAAAEPTQEQADDADADDPLMDTRSVLPGEWALPENARESLADLDKKAAELATSFDEGNLSASDYRQQADALDQNRNALRSDIRDAERAFSKAQMHWEQKTVSRFLKDNKEWQANETLLTMLDAEVRRLQAQSNDPFDPRHLLNASRNLKKAMGVEVKPKEQEKAETKPEQKAKPNPVPKGEKPKIPPTLARVPNDEINSMDGGKFARLDRLASSNPIAYEEALAKMPKAERDEYLMSA